MLAENKSRLPPDATGPSPVDKASAYDRAEQQLAALLSHGDEGALGDTAKMASMATRLKLALPHLTFAGFYRVAPSCLEESMR